MPRLLRLSFSVTGTCLQEIEINDDCPYTDEQIIDSLNGNNDLNILTSSNEGADLMKIDVSDDGTQNYGNLGTIIDSTIEGDYFDFEKDE